MLKMYCAYGVKKSRSIKCVAHLTDRFFLTGQKVEVHKNENNLFELLASFISRAGPVWDEH